MALHARLVGWLGVAALTASVLGGCSSARDEPSTDGHPRATAPGGMLRFHGSADGAADLRVVASNGHEYVVVGDTSIGDRSTPVWTSVDGRTWTRPPDLSGPDSESLWDVAAVDGRFVAAGIDSRNEPAAWWSTDGVAWHRSTVELPRGYRATEATTDLLAFLLPARRGLWALGRLGEHPALWRSTDGHSWQRVRDNSLLGRLKRRQPCCISNDSTDGPGGRAEVLTAYGTDVVYLYPR